MYGGHGKVKSMFEQVHDYLKMALVWETQSKDWYYQLNECNGQWFYHKLKAKWYNPGPINWILFCCGWK